MSEVFLSDNDSHRCSPSAEQSQPVVTQTALKLTNAAANTNTTATVTGGKRYRFTALNTGGFYFGLIDPTTAANVRWVCPLHASIEIQIPAGTTSLYYATDTNDGTGYLVELET